MRIRLFSTIFCSFLTVSAFADGAHSHGVQMVEVSGQTQIPQLSVEAIPDSMAGWNVKVSVTNFKFTPEHVNNEHVAGEGHAHLYVDGTKVARLYGPWFHLPVLGQGEHQLRVTLNANNHAEYSLNGEIIEAQILIAEE